MRTPFLAALRLAPLAAVASLSMLLAAACGDDTTTPTPPADAGTDQGTTTDGATDAGADTGTDTGAADAADAADAAPAVCLPNNTTLNVTNNGATSYIFTGGGLTAASNPALTLCRGRTYSFVIAAPGHPFIIKSIQGSTSANAFATGVTGNDVDTGTITFVVPAAAPSSLFYNCRFHDGMTGPINVIAGP